MAQGQGHFHEDHLTKQSHGDYVQLQSPELRDQWSFWPRPLLSAGQSKKSRLQILSAPGNVYKTWS